MSNTPIMNPQQQPPAMVIDQQAYTDRPDHGSVGPVIGVLAVIVILGAIAVIIGRMCSGWRITGRGQHDFESWFEKKCASCVDGLVELPQRPVAGAVEENGGSGGASPVSEQEADPKETREEEVGNQESTESARKSRVVDSHFHGQLFVNSQIFHHL